MPRLTTVDIEDFRCFRKFTVEGLSRVNLFVGRNNSGKTALLEAIEAVVSEASPFILYRASMERGESRPTGRPDEPGFLSIDVRRWFHQHHLEPGTRFIIRAHGTRDFELTRTIEQDTRSAEDLGRLSVTMGKKKQVPGLPPALPLREGFLGAGEPARVLPHGAKLDPPVVFVTTRRMTTAELLPLWAKVLLTPAETDVTNALKILDPNIERLALTEAGGQVLFKGATEPVPLGSLGDGVTRMLTLALSLVAARRGFLMVDEIETGLHYTAHRDMWRLVIETAKRLDVQVFATTHSKDCLEAIARLHEDEPTTAEEITVHRLEAGAATPVRMTAATIAGTFEGHVDVR